MARKKRDRIDTTSDTSLAHNPFGALGARFGIAADQSPGAESEPVVSENRAVDQPMLLIRKEKRKGGKAVTCIYHIASEHKVWLKKMKQRFATGGTVDDGVLTLQGDFREAAKDWLEKAGFTCRTGS